jgi:glycosyltransferase involved in cell wall biosynthesis
VEQLTARGRDSIGDDRPIVSVIVPCWNASASISRALGSVLSETSVTLECIVVDDGSTDDTVAIVEALARSDPRIVVLALPTNEGVSNARNRALELVRGEWITLLDADDRFRPGGIAALLAAGTRTAALAVIGQQVWSDGQREWIGPLYDIPDIRVPGRKSIATNSGLLYYVSPHGKLFHRSIVEGLRFEGRVLGDQPWVVRALLRAGDRIEVIGMTVYDWIRTPSAGAGSSITASTRASARRGVEAASVAEGALRSVLSEVDSTIADPAARRVVGARYVERLLRSDLGVHLSKALGRGDPTTGELLAAIEAFLATVPGGYLAASDALARDIIEPPLARWFRVPPSARAAYWSLFAAGTAADPGLAGHGSNRVARLALQLAGDERGGIRRWLAIGLAMTARLATWFGRRRRRRMP